MEITREIREYAAKEGVEAKKAKEFTETGSEIYRGNVPEGGHEHP